MTNGKGKFFPVLIAVIFIVIIIYLIANVKQSTVTCSKRTTDDLNITVEEKLESSIDGNKISAMKLTKTIILPEKYLKNDANLESIEYSIKKSYAYLGKDSVKVSKLTDRVIVYVSVSKNETIILNNISFEDSDSFVMKINSNTKSSDVVTLKVNDNYTEGELMTHLKNNGYVCQ
ncbi:MAG: hypothetical protein IJ193_01190 [Bacilli bacterium]|nr:hypothetical protein [Bacilli bacterium]